MWNTGYFGKIVHVLIRRSERGELYSHNIIDLPHLPFLIMVWDPLSPPRPSPPYTPRPNCWKEKIALFVLRFRLFPCSTAPQVEWSALITGSGALLEALKVRPVSSLEMPQCAISHPLSIPLQEEEFEVKPLRWKCRFFSGERRKCLVQDFAADSWE